jgi:tetratricopeptide (TPR) repeat protein
MNHFHSVAASLLVLLFGSAVSRAAAPDDEYVRIYNLIQQADALAEGGRAELASQKYAEALTGLDGVRKAYPGWNEQVVQFRQNYVIEKLGRTAKIAEKPLRPKRADEPVPPSSEPADRIRPLLEQVRQLTADKELLQAKLAEALSAQPAAVDPRELAVSEEKIKSLRKEVELLTVNLKKAEAKPDKPIDPVAFGQVKQGLAAANQKLAQQTEIMATMTLERDALQHRLQMFADATDVKALRGENETLKSQLAELQIKAEELKQRLIRAQADLAALQLRNANVISERKTPETTVLRARLAALESRAVPYTKEELALFNTPDSINANKTSNDVRRASGKLATNAKVLVEQAERALAARHYDEAEQKYSQAMKLDGNNLQLRASLAAAQIGQNRLAEGEANLRRALANNPRNASSLFLLGVVKVRQHRYEEALDFLSQSAQLDPQNADTFQYLGQTLAEKGLRTPAESAFRRAIQLAPDNGEAHHNLAIVYATQKPPALELARWHYQKGLASGRAKDSKLEQMLSSENKTAVGGLNASNR